MMFVPEEETTSKLGTKESKGGDFFHGGGSLNIIIRRVEINRPFPSSPQSLFQSESNCETFVTIISSNFNMNEN